MRKFTPLLFLLWPLFLWAQPPDSVLSKVGPQIRAMLEVGHQMEEEGHFLRAETQYLQSLKPRKDNSVVYQHLAWLYLRTNQWKKAEIALQRMEGDFPPEPMLTYFGKYFFNKFEIPQFERPTEAESILYEYELEDMKALVAGNPAHAPAHFELGMHYWGKGAADSLAEKHFRQAITAQSRFPEARRSLGQLLQLQKRFGEAEIHFQYNRKNVPDSLVHWDDLALLYFQWNRPARLEQTWRDHLEAIPQDQRALRNLGLLLEKQGRYVEVERLYLEYQYDQEDLANGFLLLEGHYLRSLQNYPDSIRFAQGLGELYYQQLFVRTIDWAQITKEVSDYEKYAQNMARGSLRQFLFVLEKRPDHPTLGQLNYQIGHLQLFLKNYEKAIQPLQEAVKLLKEKTDPQFELVDAYIGADQPVDALQLLEKLAEEPGLDYQHDVLFAKLLSLEGRLDEALVLADSIIAYYPNSQTPEAYRIKAFVLAQKGQADEAFEALQEVIKYDYGSGADYYQIARLYFSKEPKENGLIWLDGALEKGLAKVIVRNDPALDRLRNWDGFVEVLWNY